MIVRTGFERTSAERMNPLAALVVAAPERHDLRRLGFLLSDRERRGEQEYRAKKYKNSEHHVSPSKSK